MTLSLSLPLALSPRPVADLTGFCRSAQVLRSAQTAGRPRNHSMLRKKTRKHHVTYPYICNIHWRAQGNRCLYGALIGGGSDILHMNDTNTQHTTHSRTAVQNMHHQPRLQHSVTTGLRLWEPLTAFDSLSLSLSLFLSTPLRTSPASADPPRSCGQHRQLGGHETKACCGRKQESPRPFIMWTDGHSLSLFARLSLSLSLSFLLGFSLKV